jgi:uncharacterized protein YggE
MRHPIPLVALTLLTVPAPISAQAPIQRTITVNGQAEIKVAPDEVLLSVGIETDNVDIARARADNDARVKAVVAAATAQGVPADHIKTEFLDIQPRYREEYERRTFLGYFARRSLAITLRDPSRFEALLSAVLTAGANYVHGIDFRTTQLRKHRDDARRQAIQAAREKAADMAAALNVGLGAPVNLSEQYSGWWSPYSSWWGGRGGAMMYQNVIQDRRASGASDDALVPGQISVSAAVSVTFELASDR